MDTEELFSGIDRLYGKGASEALSGKHVCVIGLGGVGSWCVESLARTGIGKITLIDFDTISKGNINRQMHALHSTLEQKKSDVLKERVLDINPACECNIIDDFINRDNLWDLLGPDVHYDYVIDAIDSITYKAEIIYFCKRNKRPVISTGGAGGVTDPTTIMVKDLSRTYNDALAAKVRSRLRNEHGFSKNPARYFGIECVFSTQQKIFPDQCGNVSTRKPGIHGVHLDCRFGYGSVSYVTAVFGFMAVSRVINQLIKKHKD